MQSVPVITECLSHASLEMSWYQFSGLQPCEKDGPREQPSRAIRGQCRVQKGRLTENAARAQHLPKPRGRGLSVTVSLSGCDFYSPLAFLAFNHSRVSPSLAFGTLTVLFSVPCCEKFSSHQKKTPIPRVVPPTPEDGLLFASVDLCWTLGVCGILHCVAFCVWLLLVSGVQGSSCGSCMGASFLGTQQY